ncbi:hypothetical protein TrRE_jg9969, partial [Triparma retinervis]
SGLSVGGSVAYGSQQQFMTRSSEAKGGFQDPVWNGVFVGNGGQPEGRCGGDGGGHIAVSDIGRIAEKPYVVSDEKGEVFTLIIPDLQDSPAAGVPYDESGMKGGVQEVDFSSVYVTQVEDGSKEINSALSQGLHVVVSPGIYELDDTLVVEGEGQVVLGLGLATLIAPPSGGPCVAAKGTNARVAGLLLEAGPYSSSSLLSVSGFDVVVTDVFARVGGPTTGVGPVGSMFDVRGDRAIIDNTWLWRADHAEGDDGEDELVANGDNACTNGMVV